MVFNRNKLFNSFPWLKEKKLSMIVSADYDGLICASFLSHHQAQYDHIQTDAVPHGQLRNQLLLLHYVQVKLRVYILLTYY